MKKLQTADIEFIQKKLIDWFKKNQRALPWRKNYDPYQVWISEIMLQQTQVTTVLPYFDQWIKKLPDIKSVADAKEDTILKLWEGLGYYSRARNLQKAAKVIVEKHNGQLPNDPKAILELPGIGKYTAGAISSIAFNKPEPIVDGNVIRVIARLMNYSKNTRLPENIKHFWNWMEKSVPKEAREFNQGMMELGALICSPKNPKCDRCPLKSRCASNKKGTMNLLPNRGKKIEKVPIKVAIAIIEKGEKIFIQKRPSKGLMGGLWEFPGGKVEKETVKEALKREIKEEIGIEISNIKPFHRIKHGYTKFSVDLHCFRAKTTDKKIPSKGKWVKIEELKKYPFPAANVRIIEKLMLQESDYRSIT